MERECKKCGTVNAAATGAVMEACPQCGAIYQKVELALARQRQIEATRRQVAERMASRRPAVAGPPSVPESASSHRLLGAVGFALFILVAVQVWFAGKEPAKDPKPPPRVVQVQPTPPAARAPAPAAPAVVKPAPPAAQGRGVKSAREYEAQHACEAAIERSARYSFEWTDSIFGDARFDRFEAAERNGRREYRMIGRALKMQNGFGAWQRMAYGCMVDVETLAVIPTVTPLEDL